MGIGGASIICLCISTLWASNLFVARRKRLESGGTHHSNIFGVPTRHPWGLYKSEMGEVRVTGVGEVRSPEVTVPLAGESSELGARISIGDGPGAASSSPALNGKRASVDRTGLLPLGMGSTYSKSSDVEGGAGSSGLSASEITPSISCEPGSGGEVGAETALERARQSRVRRQASLNKNSKLRLSSGGPTVPTEGGAAVRTPALNKLRSFLNELSDGADSVARKMSGSGRRSEAEASDAAPSTWWQKRKPSAPRAPPGAPSSSSGDDAPFVPREGRGTLPTWNGSSAASLVDKEYSSNYTADVNVHEAPWLDAAEGSRGAGSSQQGPLAFQKWRAEMRAAGYSDDDLTEEAHRFATRAGSVARPPARAAPGAAAPEEEKEEKIVVHI